MEYDIDKDDEWFDMLGSHLGNRTPVASHNELMGDVLLKTNYQTPQKSELSRRGESGGQNQSDLKRMQQYETESILNNVGLLRRPSTPGRHRGFGDTQIPQPTALKQR